jgi:biopolymer transport protein ExbD
MKRKRFNFFDNDISSEVSLTPLIDTVLVLLIVFIAATPVINQSIKVSLPNGYLNEYKDSKNDICFAMDQYGFIYNIKKEKIDLEKVKLEIEKNIKNIDTSVIIFVDQDALSGKLIELIDLIKITGIKNVYCKTKKIQI